ncbi:MAG: flagellar biosynthesis protein FlgC [Alphaproteobacteria bacterium]|nr:flagellar biosynthesis protein FlgC [Alphaproteobacteria bacterium]
MMDAISIALSGLMAQSQRLAASASNIANVNTTGVLPTMEAPFSTVYKPLNVSYTALMVENGIGGGIKTEVLSDPSGYSTVYDPSSVYANTDGFIAAPNIDLTREIVNLLEIKSLFKANLAIIKTHDKMMGELLDTIT